MLYVSFWGRAATFVAGTVLIADDNAVNRAVPDNILKGEYETLQASVGHAGPGDHGVCLL